MTMTSWLGRTLQNVMNPGEVKDLMQVQLKELYCAQEKLILNLPVMADAAACMTLKEALFRHIERAREHQIRLNVTFLISKCDCNEVTCPAVESAIHEAGKALHDLSETEFRDRILTQACQKINQYVMNDFGCARVFARQVGNNSIADLLQDCLDQEREWSEELAELIAIPSHNLATY